MEQDRNKTAAGKELRLEQVLAFGRTTLKVAGITEYDLDAWYLFSQAFHMDKTQYYLHGKDPVPTGNEEFSQYGEMLLKRASRVPLQYILGTQDFMGLTFLVDENVLIPRQDTETLVETVLKENPDRASSILDMCTGSGCIAVSLSVLGKYGHVEGADISPGALAVAVKNAVQISGGTEESDGSDRPDAEGSDELGPEGSDWRGAVCGSCSVRFRLSDLFSAFEPGEVFDVIVSNPPYIPTKVIEGLEPEVRNFEPMNALDGTEDGLFFYRRLAKECPAFLKDGGKIYFEIGYDQGTAVSELLAAGGFEEIRVIKDLAGKDRVVCGKMQARQAANR